MFKMLLRLREPGREKKERLMLLHIEKCVQRQLNNILWEPVHNKFFNLTFYSNYLLQVPVAVAVPVPGVCNQIELFITIRQSDME